MGILEVLFFSIILGFILGSGWMVITIPSLTEKDMTAISFDTGQTLRVVLTILVAAVAGVLTKIFNCATPVLWAAVTSVFFLVFTEFLTRLKTLRNGSK